MCSSEPRILLPPAYSNFPFPTCDLTPSSPETPSPASSSHEPTADDALRVLSDQPQRLTSPQSRHCRKDNCGQTVAAGTRQDPATVLKHHQSMTGKRSRRGATDGRSCRTSHSASPPRPTWPMYRRRPDPRTAGAGERRSAAWEQQPMKNGDERRTARRRLSTPGSPWDHPIASPEKTGFKIQTQQHVT